MVIEGNALGSPMNGNGVNGRAGLGSPGGGGGGFLYGSSGLLGRARAVPPPTLPRHSSNSFNAGNGNGNGLANGASLRDRADPTGGSCRLASLERLALRQRLIDQPDATVSSSFVNPCYWSSTLILPPKAPFSCSFCLHASFMGNMFGSISGQLVKGLKNHL